MKILNELAILLLDYNKTLATAESCTGGLLGYLFTKIPDCSKWYYGGIISYATTAKTEILKISKSLLSKYGTVSKEVTKQMADHCQKKFKTDYAIAVTGFAGPTSDNNVKIGTVFIAIANPALKTTVSEFLFSGDRETIRKKIAKQAIQLLILEIKNNS